VLSEERGLILVARRWMEALGWSAAFTNRRWPV